METYSAVDDKDDVVGDYDFGEIGVTGDVTQKDVVDDATEDESKMKWS